MTNEQRKEFYMNRNIKLSPSIIALTWDVIFVWTISTLYFTQVKFLTNSQVVLLDSILMLFGCLFCVPVSKIFQRLSPIKSVRIGLFGYAGYLLLCIVGESFLTFVLAQPFLAFGYAVMSVKVNGVLNDSLAVVKRDKDYQRIYGKGLSFYYIIECVGSVIITYVYNIEASLAYWASILIVAITFLLTFLYKEPAKFMDKNVDIQAKEKSNSKTPDKFGKILKSGFLISLLIYCFFYRGILSTTSASLKIYLNGLINNGTIPLWSFGYLFAGSRICSAISSKYQFKFNLKFGVRSLLIFNFLILFTYTFAGIAYLLNPGTLVPVIVIIILSYIQCSLRMPNQIFINNYIQVCTHKKNVERVYSLKTMVEYLGFAVISFVYSTLLAVFNDNYGLTSLVYIAIFAVPLIISLVFFLKNLTRKHAQKYTIIKDEYVND